MYRLVIDMFKCRNIETNIEFYPTNRFRFLIRTATVSDYINDSNREERII